MRHIESELDRFMKTLKFLAIAVMLSGITLPVTADSQFPRHHPDGLVGRFNASLEAAYAYVTAGDKVSLVDRSCFGAGLRCPIIPQSTFELGYTLEHGDSLFHSYHLAAKTYLADPLRDASNLNPDGAVGAPIVSISFIGRIPDVAPSKHRFEAGVAVSLPLSRNFTIGAGWNYYQKETPFQADKFFGLVNFFPRNYFPGEEYSNPDGIEGYPSFYLRGGGSDNGFFGQLEVAIPIEPRLTMILIIRGERVPSLYTRTAMLGGRINFYPGNQ